MATAIWIALGLIAGVMLIGVGWRYASRRWQLPCPSLFAWTLEGDFSGLWLRTRETLDCLDLKPGMRILELGPGPGRLLIPAAQRVLPGGEAVGLDIQPGMIQRLARRAAKKGVTNLKTALGDAADMHFPSDSFDVVFLCTALGEIPDRQAALRHAYDYLTPGGLLSITELAGDPHYQSRAMLLRLCEQAGFRHERTIGPRWFFTMNFRKP